MILLVLVVPGYLYHLENSLFHCNARSDKKVHPNTFVKLPIEWLKIDKEYEGEFDSVNGFVREFVNYNVIVFDIYIPLNLEKDILSKVDIVEGTKLSH